MAPTYPELVKVVREGERLLDEKNQGSRELIKANSKAKVSVQVEKSALEDDSEEEMEVGKSCVSPVVQSVTEAAPVELLAQVVQV